MAERLSRDELYELYWVRKLSLKRMESITGIPDATLRRWMIKDGIPLRSRSDALKLYIATHPDANQHHSYWKGKSLPKDMKDKMSAFRQGKTYEDLYGVERAIEVKKNVGDSIRGEKNGNYGKKRPKHVCEALSKAHLGKKLSEEHKAKILKESLKVQGMGKKSKIEKRVERVVHNFHLPYVYTGDGKLTIGGLCPDFANCNGKKKLIELFGDYWHSDELVKKYGWKRGEFGRKAVFSQLGFDCLILWESEINKMSDEEIVAKIEEFTNG